MQKSSEANIIAKYRCLYGEQVQKNQQYANLSIQDSLIEGNTICSNEKFIAFNWKSGGGGSIHIRKIEQQGIIQQKDIHLLTGHKGQIQDISFSPHYENLLASGSADCTLKLWNIPDEGLLSSIKQSDADLCGHSKKVMLLQWHPSAEFTIASASQDGSIKIWDVKNQVFSMQQDIQSHPFSLQWNFDGSMIASITKDKKLHIIDPRKNGTALATNAHQGIKAQKLQWKGKNGNIITVGSSDKNYQEFAVFDPRSLQSPLVMKKLDNSSSNFQIHYNEFNKIFYVSNKNSNTLYYYFNQSQGTPDMIYLDKYNGVDNQQSTYFLQKRSVDIWEKEIDRAIRLTNRYAEFIAFKLPLKSEEMNTYLKKEYYSSQPSLSHEEWLQNNDKDPIICEFDLSQREIIKSQSRIFQFQNIPQIQYIQGPEKIIKETVIETKEIIIKESLDADKQTIQNLKFELRESKDKIEFQQNTIKDLQEAIQLQNDMIQEFEKTITNLNNELEKSNREKMKPPPKRLTYSRIPPKLPILGYWDIRGFAQGIRYQLVYQGVEFEDKYFLTTNDQSSLDSWEKEQFSYGLDFPSLPFFVDTDGYVITETLTIHEYIAMKWMPDLMGKTQKDRANLQMLSSLIHSLKIKLTEMCNQEDLNFDEFYLYIKENLLHLSNFLQKSNGGFLLGSYDLCYMDFYLFEFILFLEFVSEDQIYEWYPIFGEYRNRIAELPRLSSYLESDAQTILQFPFNMKFCKINNLSS